MAKMSEKAYVIGGSDWLSKEKKLYIRLEKGSSDIIAIFRGFFT
jgi:hypothetical protein